MTDQEMKTCPVAGHSHKSKGALCPAVKDKVHALADLMEGIDRSADAEASEIHAKLALRFKKRACVSNNIEPTDVAGMVSEFKRIAQELSG